jgi:hypothetical protein
MKTLKITIALVAVLLLTVSGVKSETVAASNDEPTYKEQASYDLLAHTKKKTKVQTQG